MCKAIRYLTGQLENSPVLLVDTFRVVKIIFSLNTPLSAIIIIANSKLIITITIIINEFTALQANGADEDGTTFPGLGKIDYVLTEASVSLAAIVIMISHHPTIGIIMSHDQPSEHGNERCC